MDREGGMIPKNAIFARSSGRMMQELTYTGRGADCICPGATVFVKPHPRNGEKLERYERDRTFLWPESHVYRPGISPDLDLLEYADWLSFYPENLKIVTEMQA